MRHLMAPLVLAIAACGGGGSDEGKSVPMADIQASIAASQPKETDLLVITGPSPFAAKSQADQIMKPPPPGPGSGPTYCNASGPCTDTH